MSKHHHYHPNSSGNYHTATKKSHLDQHDSDMMMMMPHGHHGISHGTNGLRPNGVTNGDVDLNDTNNNHNKHHTHHKRSAGNSGSGAETSSSKRTKLSGPSEKSGKSESSGNGVRTQQSHYNIMDKLKELYKELKADKSCKEVSGLGGVRCEIQYSLRFCPFSVKSLAVVVFAR
jgi:hypothetical protein